MKSTVPTDNTGSDLGCKFTLIMVLKIYSCRMGNITEESPCTPTSFWTQGVHDTSFDTGCVQDTNKNRELAPHRSATPLFIKQERLVYWRKPTRS